MNMADTKYEYNLLKDTFLGSYEMIQKKLRYLEKLAQKEQWDYSGRNDKSILYNYLCFTYDKILEESKFSFTEDKKYMCFNTGLLTKHDVDIYALFTENENPKKKAGQDWFLYGFKVSTDKEMRVFDKLPEIADYFTNPSDFIFDKSLNLTVDYEHIIEDNYDRFKEIGLEDKYTINAFLVNAVNRITEKVKRNYKLAIPQYYTDKKTGDSRIQLLLPLFLQSQDKADLALAVDKDSQGYVGRTILTLEWAYVNSRRIVRPEVEWLKI